MKQKPGDDLLANIEGGGESAPASTGEPSGASSGSKPESEPSPERNLELYNLVDDPSETTNLAGKHPEKVKELLAHLNRYAKEAVPPKGGPQPAETVARLRELGCPVVMGNADAWLLSGRVQNPAEAVTEQLLAVREWSLARLSEPDRRFIDGFQPAIDVPLDDRRRLLCFHGSPQSFDDLIWPETDEAEGEEDVE